MNKLLMHVMLGSAFAARSLLDCARMYFRLLAFPLTFGSIIYLRTHFQIKERVIRAVLDGQDQQQQDQFPLAFKSMQFSRFSKSRAHMIGVSTGEDSF